MTARLARIATLGVLLAWLVDRTLRGEAAAHGRSGPPPIESLIVIDAPIERVWTVVADVVGQPRWMHDMKSVRLLDAGPVRVGTRGEATVLAFGIAVTDAVTITAFDPPRRFALSHDGFVRGSGVITLEPGADGSTTIVRWSETLVPRLLPALGGLLLGRVFGPIFRADLRRLRTLVERREPAASD